MFYLLPDRYVSVRQLHLPAGCHDKVVETRDGDGDASVRGSNVASIMFIFFLRVRVWPRRGAVLA